MSIRDRLFGQHVAEQAPLPPPVPPPVPLAERYWWCRGCDVKWQGSDPACWCCGEVAA